MSERDPMYWWHAGRPRADADDYQARYRIVDRIVCADGFSVSVQANAGAYCTPRDAEGPWCAVEMGFPSAPMGDEFTRYCEDPERPTDTVYGYVPVELVEALIARHGGALRAGTVG